MRSESPAGAELPVWRPRGAEGQGGRGVEKAMEECDAGPAPTARVGSGAAGVRLAPARAEVGQGRRFMLVVHEPVIKVNGNLVV